MERATPFDTPDRRVVVWDLPVRIVHWSIAALVAAAYVTWRLDRLDWHVWIGYATLTLVVFRILWGCFGSETARFARFVAGPRAAAAHLRHLWRREPDRQIGHNPAGGWMVLLLLFLLLAETLTGLYVSNDVADEGPLTEIVAAPIANAITALHGLFWDALAAAAVLHVLAILVYRLAKGQSLIPPMIRGWKRLPASLTPPRLAGAGRAWLLGGCSVLAVAALVHFL